MEYVFTTARGSTTPPHDHGLVAVIDGQSIKVTPFMAANVPPPMALHEITVNSNAADVAFNGDSSIAVLHQQGISLFEYKNVSASGSPPTLNGRFTFEETESPESFYQQISFSQNNEILVLQQYQGGSVIKRYGFNEDSGRMEEKPQDSPTSMISLLSTFNEGGLIQPFVQDMSGSLYSLGSGVHSQLPCRFPMNLPWVEIAPRDDSHIAFGMSANGHLYANTRLLVKNCTSFLVTPAHLIFTTTSHLIKFVHITDVDSM